VTDREFPTALVGAALVLSLVHYTDNYVNFDAYPQEGAPIEISRDLVWIGWLFYAAFAVAAYFWWQRGYIRAACMGLAVFSISGLISIGHYTADGTSALAAWRHVFIWVDISLGAAILAFAIRTALRSADATTPLRGQTP